MTSPSADEDETWQSLHRQLSRIAVRRLPTGLRGRADDLVQELFVWAFAEHPGKTPAELAALLTAHLRYRVIDEVNRVKAEPRLLEPGEALPDRSDDELRYDEQLNEAQREWLALHFHTLPHRERSVLELTVQQKLTGPEVASLLGLSRENVYQIKSRTIKRLERLDPPALDAGDRDEP
ncbi:MAG: sigma-70 family RNA polymerase sigma factor [Hamadaea sp.]|uniref:RNA polymerase sigma factor n=1 Tax=Hamadaea sp. NPDC050747 TaxID=3155789 RepID=UPI00183ADB69|nr:sigma-70 family RNA polymerase sigma factor [Hamadaea sp.]